MTTKVVTSGQLGTINFGMQLQISVYLSTQQSKQSLIIMTTKLVTSGRLGTSYLVCNYKSPLIYPHNRVRDYDYYSQLIIVVEGYKLGSSRLYTLTIMNLQTHQPYLIQTAIRVAIQVLQHTSTSYNNYCGYTESQFQLNLFW